MTSSVERHLRTRGLVPPGVALTIEPMSGGVSNDVFAVAGTGVDLVVKRALGRLRVDEEWIADPDRIDTEAQAMATVARLSPGLTAPLVDIGSGYLVMRRAPRDSTNWRDDLLAGTADDTVAARLGAALAHVQTATAADPDVLSAFADRHAFHQLRVEPFYLAAGRRNPDLAEVVRETVETMLERRDCLVHGDFTPKNILVRRGEVLILDWEVAHVGDPTFDVALLLTHLLLKAVHSPVMAAAVEKCARAFEAAYVAGRPAGMPLAEVDGFARQVGCLLLARVDGKSPAGYLSETDRLRTRELARLLLGGSTATIEHAWAHLR